MDIETNLVGIAEDEKVYYISVNIRTFIKELLLFNDYVNQSNLPENPDDLQLAEFADKFLSQLLELDKTICKSEFWS
ncbi:MAG: hypothetical protein K2I80_08200 [Ruminococcus sp.]|nr:hypothetical protein [Ruminococcus sp.]